MQKQGSLYKWASIQLLWCCIIEKKTGYTSLCDIVKCVGQFKQEGVCRFQRLRLGRAKWWEVGNFFVECKCKLHGEILGTALQVNSGDTWKKNKD